MSSQSPQHFKTLTYLKEAHKIWRRQGKTLVLKTGENEILGFNYFAAFIVHVASLLIPIIIFLILVSRFNLHALIKDIYPMIFFVVVSTYVLTPLVATVLSYFLYGFVYVAKKLFKQY